MARARRLGFLQNRSFPPSQQEKFSHHHHVAAPAMRCRTHVSAFALTVYWHDPNGTPIVTARFPGSTAWRCRGRFHGAPLIYIAFANIPDLLLVFVANIFHKSTNIGRICQPRSDFLITVLPLSLMPTCRLGYGYRKLQLRAPNAQLGVQVTHPPHVYIEAQKPHFKIRVLIIDLPDPIVQFDRIQLI